MKSPAELLPDLERYYERAQQHQAVADLYQALITRLESDMKWINTVKAND